MVRRPKIRDPVAETLDEIAEEHGYGSTDEAITHALREAGYNV
jgi:metal-responsive CopG/Arc/MetJ family transcriptional regulator